jgi:hypothetical protein
MKRKQTNTLRGEFEATRLDQLAQQLEWREWTTALLTQRIAALDEKLAAGDMPILDGVVRLEVDLVTHGEPNHLPNNSAPLPEQLSEESDDIDSLAAFLDA